MNLKKFTQKDRYGNTMSYEFEGDTKPLDPTALMKTQMEQMAQMEPPPVGGEEFVPGNPATHPGEPRGADTVPAWLTPGEFVVNAEAMSIPENAQMVEAINNQGRAMQQGGGVEYHNLGGLAAGALLPNPHMQTIQSLGVGLGSGDMSVGNQDDAMLKAYSATVPKQVYDKGFLGFGRGFRDLTEEEIAERQAQIEAGKERADRYFQGDIGVGHYLRGGSIDELNALTQDMGGNWADAKLEQGTPAEVMKERAQIMGEALQYAPDAAEEAFRWYNPMTWGMNEGGEIRNQAMAQAELLAALPGGPQTAKDYYASQIAMQQAADLANANLAAMYEEQYKNDGGEIPMPIPYTQALLEEREGYRPEVYLDSLGKPTVGHGHLIADEVWEKDDPRIGTQPYTKEELDSFFADDMQTAESAARRNVGDEVFDGLDRRQRAALTSMAFQLGPKGQSKFKKMIKAIQEGNHEQAALEAVTGSEGGKSRWLKQTPKRALDLAEAFSPEVAAQYRNNGGQVFDDMQTQRYFFDGGYLMDQINADPEAKAASDARQATVQDWLNENVMGEKTQIPEPVVVPEPVVDAPIREEEVEPERPWWAGEKYNDPYATISGDMGRHFTEEDMGEGSEEAIAEEVITESDPYQEHVARAKAVGRTPMSAFEFKETFTPDETGQTKADRMAPASDTSESKNAVEAANEVLAAGGTEEQAQDAANVAAATGDVAKAVAKQNLNDLVAESEDEDTPDKSTETSPETQTTQEVETVGEDEVKKPGVLDGIMGFFDDLGIGDLFDKKEMARMAVLYAGSRALGYSHGGSLNWAAKQYLNRVDTKSQQYDQLAMSGKFTKESLHAYKKSGDLADLAPVGTPPKAKGEFKEFFRNGKKVRAQKYETASGDIVWRGANGQVIDSSYSDDAAFHKDTPEYRARRKRAVDQSSVAFEEVMKSEDMYRDGDNVKYNTNIKPNAAARTFWSWSESMGLDPESDEAQRIMTDAYRVAIQDGKSGKYKVNDLKPYLDQMYIRESTNAPQLFTTNNDAVNAGKEEPKYVRADKMAKLGRNIDHLTRSIPRWQNMEPTQARAQFYSFAMSQWNKLSPQEQEKYDKSAEKGETGFYFYVNTKLADLQSKL